MCDKSLLRVAEYGASTSRKFLRSLVPDPKPKKRIDFVRHSVECFENNIFWNVCGRVIVHSGSFKKKQKGKFVNKKRKIRYKNMNKGALNYSTMASFILIVWRQTMCSYSHGFCDENYSIINQKQALHIFCSKSS